MDGYEPLVDRWAAAGFVVVQPTHLDSRRHGIGFDGPRFGTIWRVRIADLHAVLDQLSPAPWSLMVIPGEHTFGGIAGEAVGETTVADPARVAATIAAP